ncbi:hypothetical protein ER70_09490, partial (plasmid) [Borreliella bissettiae]
KIIKDVVDAIKSGISGAFDGIKNIGSSLYNTGSNVVSNIAYYGNPFNYFSWGNKNNNTGGDDLGNFN